MKLILDTHAFLWLVMDDPKLSSTAKSAYLDIENEIYLSSASIWEMAIKISLDKLRLNTTLEAFVMEHIHGNNIKILNIQLLHLYNIETLPFHHRDPFDRLIIAQAITENHPVVSADPHFDAYPITRIW